MNTARLTHPHAAADRQAIVLLVHRFYDDVRADGLLGPTFDAVLAERWEAHLPRMGRVLEHRRVGDAQLQRQRLRQAHGDSGCHPQHFSRWLTLWFAHTEALFAAGTAAEFQEMAIGIARNLYRGYFGHPAAFDGIESELHNAHR